eukprot:403353774
MEDSGIGHHCAFELCNKKDFFAFQCGSCEKYYCGDHRHVTCEMTPMNIDRPQIQSSVVVCSHYDDPNNQESFCKRPGVSKCHYCHLQFCLDHRFENQHHCLGLKILETQKQEKEEVKSSILDKIREKKEMQFQSSIPKSSNKMNEKQKKLNKTVMRIKTKQSAKGDQKISKDRRFAINIEISEYITSNERGGDKTSSNTAVFFDKAMSLGQVIDAYCKVSGIRQVLDYDNLQETQIYFAHEDLAGNVNRLDFEIKLENISSTIEGFEQGDTLILMRGIEFMS